MTQLRGMAVTLTTAPDSEAGTDDKLFIGVIGAGGGREFPLDSPAEDFIEGKTEKFVLGSIWEGNVIDNETKFPLESQPGQNNDPAYMYVDMDLVNIVYLRKQESGQVYRLQGLEVRLYGPSAPSRKVFHFLNTTAAPKPPLWMSLAYGNVVYLGETRLS
ncbi:MAG: hypothetical protein M3361_05970 [Candidatus Tectomicrobia bacterium]|nr:hypothetical protein [Candidatus Tectomicrobia bacterium]